MLDSAKIYFNSTQFDVADTNLYAACFNSERQIFRTTNKQKKEVSYIRNVHATKALKEKWGGYFPKVFVQRFPFQRHPFAFQLGVELSVPKFTYGTNFYEFNERDIPTFAKKLHDLMWFLGISLNDWQVPLGRVESLDYCKNFILPNEITGHRFFGVIKKYELKNTADFGYTDYVNGRRGEMVRYFQNNKNLRIYEKVAEVCYRASTPEELAIATNPPFPALPRMELAVHESRTFHQVVSDARTSEGLVVKDDYTVHDLFKSRMAKRVLLKEFRDFLKPWATSLITTGDIQDDIAFAMIDQASPSFEMACVIEKLRCDTEAIGIKNAFVEFRKNFMAHKKKATSPATFYRYQAEVKSILNSINLPKTTPAFDVLRFARNEIKQFQLLRPPWL